MIKRIIFDIDNTLIPWEEEYNEQIKEVLKELHIQYTIEEYNKIIEAFNKYEDEYYIFDEGLMLEYINKYTNNEYPKIFLTKILKKWENCVENKINPQIANTLEYLKSKYELVVLTDWYEQQQKQRLQNAGILKYFENIYSSEKTKRKPFKEAFIQAIGTNKPQECVMIGDNLERDIKGALNAGLNAIWFNPNFQNDQNNKYLIVTQIEKLKHIL